MAITGHNYESQYTFLNSWVQEQLPALSVTVASRACIIGSPGSPGSLLWAVFGWQAIEGVGGGADDNTRP